MPGLADPNFNSTVTLICEHNSDGALGIVINRPMKMNLGGLFQQLAPDEKVDRKAAVTPVMLGGPVARERGFVLHNPAESFDSSVSVSDELQLTLSRDILDAMAVGQGPDKTLVALGYAGWQPGQLEAEMLHNTWLTVPATNEIIFDVPFSERWTSAAASMGVNISQISPDVGHA